MPSLTDANVAVPAIVIENMITSIETRVTAPSLTPHPLLTFPKMTTPTTVACFPADLPHPCSLTHTASFLRDMGLEVLTEGTPSTGQVLLTVPTPSTVYSGVDPLKLPMAATPSTWSIHPGRSGPYFQRSKTRLSSKLLGRFEGRTSTISETPGSQSRRGVTSTPTLTSSTISCGKVAAKDTPLRELVNRFLALPELKWLHQVTEPLPFETWLKRYPEIKREQLRKARSEILGAGKIQRKDALVKNFIKRETTDSFVDPRNISPRTDGFLSILGPYISAVEHKAVRAKFLVKGLGPKQRAAKMAWLAEYAEYVEVDYSRFDMTISEQIIRIFELHVLKCPFPENEHGIFHQALDMTLKTTGISSFGTRYQRQGGRCSGDAHTSIANGLLNYFLTWVCLGPLDRHLWRSTHEGDDGIIAFRGIDRRQVEANLSFLHLLGFKAKLKFTKILEDVTFCGRHYFFDDHGLSEQAVVPRALKKFNTTMTLGRNKILLLAKALSYNYTDGDTPLIGALTYAVVTVLKSDPECQSPRRLRSALAAISQERWLLRDTGVSVTQTHINDVRPPRVSPHARATCALADGVSIQLQQLLENEYLSWIDLGFIPDKVTKLHYDWAPDGPTIVVCGDITRFIL